MWSVWVKSMFRFFIIFLRRNLHSRNYITRWEICCPISLKIVKFSFLSDIFLSPCYVHYIPHNESWLLWFTRNPAHLVMRKRDCRVESISESLRESQGYRVYARMGIIAWSVKASECFLDHTGFPLADSAWDPELFRELGNRSLSRIQEFFPGW